MAEHVVSVVSKPDGPVVEAPKPQQAKREEFLALPDNMPLNKQLEELKKHADTPMTYAEMRAKFG
jgi:hypothetical protein